MLSAIKNQSEVTSRLSIYGGISSLGEPMLPAPSHPLCTTLNRAKLIDFTVGLIELGKPQRIPIVHEINRETS